MLIFYLPLAALRTATRPARRPKSQLLNGREYVNPAAAYVVGHPTEQYRLYDFTRFKVLEEVLREYVPGVLPGSAAMPTLFGDGCTAPHPFSGRPAHPALQGQREFFAPCYDTPQQQSTLADLRNLPYWNPDVRMQQGREQQLTLYASDQPGRYLVVVQGLVTDGRCGSASTLLDVKPAL